MQSNKQNRVKFSTDNRLIDGCLANDPAAQKQLFECFAGKMMGVCLRYANNREVAQDILQDGFVKVFEKLNTFKREGSLEGWIRRIIVNTALDNYRKNKLTDQHIDLDNVDYMIASNDFAFEKLAAEDLLKVLNSIPSGYRTIFNLYAIEGYSHKEISEKMDISVNTSKSQYSRAKAFLRDIIEKQELK